ncbi:hypothetical protein MTO96_021657 [Rhipicephalus appendiculatus]
MFTDTQADNQNESSSDGAAVFSHPRQPPGGHRRHESVDRANAAAVCHRLRDRDSNAVDDCPREPNTVESNTGTRIALGAAGKVKRKERSAVLQRR